MLFSKYEGKTSDYEIINFYRGQEIIACLASNNNNGYVSLDYWGTLHHFPLKSVVTTSSLTNATYLPI